MLSHHHARQLGQHIHGNAHTRRAPTPIAFDGLEMANGIKAHVSNRVIAARDSDATTDANTSQKPVTSSSFTLPIACGIVVPVVAATILFVYLQRRHVKKQREEDANDRHRSLDFGLGDVPGGMKQGPSVSITDIENIEKGINSRSARQKSMDMNLESPYLLPPELENSRESLQRASPEADPYRPITQYTSHGDNASIRSFPHDNASTYTRSSAAPSRLQESSELLGNAAGIAKNSPPRPGYHPPRQNSLPKDSSSPHSPSVQTNVPPTSLRPGSTITPTSPLAALENLTMAQPAPVPTIKMPDGPEEPALATPGPSLQQTSNRKPPPTLPNLAGAPKEPLPIIQAPRGSVGSDYGDAFQITPPSPTQEEKARNHRGSRYSMDVPPEEFAKLGVGAPGFDPKRLSMGFRPLPPDATTEGEDPEARANRIRSFYKEYFDDSKPAPKGQYYHEEEENYLGEAAYFDPDTNNFVMPFAEPVTRRAMTPPPRGPKFQGPPRAMHGSMGGSSMRAESPGPRAQSSASQRMPPPRAKKPLPPPSPLNSLPTPAQLGDDSFAIMGALEFAPPTTFRDRQAGIRPESPMGEKRAYSPHVPAHTPLQSSFEELSPMPSPHMLRNSKTFTSLDFAAPRKIRDPADGNASDAGSIRSNRSGVSEMQTAAIRSGAYRVSRLPQDMVFSKDDMAANLKPTWGMRQKEFNHPSTSK